VVKTQASQIKRTYGSSYSISLLNEESSALKEGKPKNKGLMFRLSSEAKKESRFVGGAEPIVPLVLP